MGLAEVKQLSVYAVGTMVDCDILKGVSPPAVNNADCDADRNLGLVGFLMSDELKVTEVPLCLASVDMMIRSSAETGPYGNHIGTHLCLFQPTELFVLSVLLNLCRVSSLGCQSQ